MKVIRVTHAPSPIAWFAPCVGQVSQVTDVYEPTGYLRVRLHYRTYWDNAIDSHYQVDGWIPPDFVEEVVQNLLVSE